MRNELGELPEDLRLTRLALGIALGWALFRVADGVATLVTTFLADYGGAYSFSGAPLTWYVGDRAVTLDALVQGLVALAVVLLAATLVARRRSKA